jgi:hypothetical protein
MLDPNTGKFHSQSATTDISRQDIQDCFAAPASPHQAQPSEVEHFAPAAQ